MTVPTNILQVPSVVIPKEDVSNLITRISQDQTPFLSLIGTNQKHNTTFEWLERGGESTDLSNAHVEGDDTAIEASSQPSQKKNIMQISKKSFGVSGTSKEVDVHGRESLVAEQLEVKGIALRTDKEGIVLNNQAGGLGNNTSTARTLAGLPTWLQTNVSRGSGGANATQTAGMPSATVTAGTAAALTEARLKDVIKSMFDNGAKVNGATVFVGSFNKQAISNGFTGANTRNIIMDSKATVHSSVDFYVTDFGQVKVVTSLNQAASDCFVIDPNYVKLAELRKEKLTHLGKSGDSEKYQIITEYSIEVNEKGLGVVADCTTS